MANNGVAPAQMELPGAVAGTPKEVPTMSDDKRPRPDGVAGDPGTAAVARLQEEVTRLRLQVEDEVRTRRVVIVDEQGLDRIRLSVDADGGCCVSLLDPDGFERSTLFGDRGGGALRISSRPLGEDAIRVDVFAVDPEDDAGAYVGVELIDGGNSVAGFTVTESREPRTWTAP